MFFSRIWRKQFKIYKKSLKNARFKATDRHKAIRVVQSAPRKGSDQTKEGYEGFQVPGHYDDRFWIHDRPTGAENC